ncbi:MAG: response regulator, partial [Lentisphaerae bacterium]|nr:response regulator [Lentisphaerota bacterium]
MPRRVLVIDDDLAVRKSFELALEDTDLHLETAESGLKGLALLRETPYDLVILDLKMPEINGVETLGRIRKINTGVLVYILTAFHREFLDPLKVLSKVLETEPCLIFLLF